MTPPTSTGVVFEVIANSKPQVLWSGAVIWQCPKKMVAQKPYTVVLRVEKGRLDSFELGLDQSISKKKYGVNVATRTEAQLKGEDFAIVLEDVSDRKVVGDSVYQEWVWQVTPKSFGPHRLVIVVSPVAQLKDVVGGNLEGETPYGDPFRDYQDVDVSMNWNSFFREQFPQWSNIAFGTFLGLLISSLGWVIGRRKARRSMQADPPDSTPDSSPPPPSQG
jgi:hypothetical protein